MRRLSILRNLHCDILVFDTIGASWIHYCIPDRYKIAFLDIRTQIPVFLNHIFLYTFLKKVVSKHRIRAGYLTYALLCALLDQIKPTLILTCADNNPLLARYAEENPGLPVVCIQNALRDTIGSIKPGLRLPYYLALGQVESTIFQSIGIDCSHYRPIGSVKLGLALIRAKNNRCPSFDICFISHYRPELTTTEASELFKLIELNQRFLFSYLVDYASKHNLSLAVASKTRDIKLQTIERKYFEEIAGATPFHFVTADKDEHEFDSYLTGLYSDLIVTLASTLGFELLATGKKVLFGATADSALMKKWGAEHYFDVLPNIVKLQHNTKVEVALHCDQIRAITTHKYKDITNTAATNIISMPNNEYPHDSVKHIIEKLFNTI